MKDNVVLVKCVTICYIKTIFLKKYLFFFLRYVIVSLKKVTNAFEINGSYVVLRSVKHPQLSSYNNINCSYNRCNVTAVVPTVILFPPLDSDNK